MRSKDRFFVSGLVFLFLGAASYLVWALTGTLYMRNGNSWSPSLVQNGFGYTRDLFLPPVLVWLALGVLCVLVSLVGRSDSK